MGADQERKEVVKVAPPPRSPAVSGRSHRRESGLSPDPRGAIPRTPTPPQTPQQGRHHQAGRSPSTTAWLALLHSSVFVRAALCVPPIKGIAAKDLWRLQLAQGPAGVQARRNPNHAPRSKVARRWGLSPFPILFGVFAIPA